MSKFTIESWIWYGCTMIVVLARYASRIWHFRSVLRLKVEDWFMAFLVGLYTVLIAFLNVDYNVSTNLINPDDPVVLTPEEISTRTWGSKTVLLVEQSMCAIQWGGKGCLLILYWRLTQNLRQHLAVKLVTAYVVITYCVMFILYFGVWCRPFHDYWQVPTNNTQCTTALNHLITNLSFNLSSDLMIMAIPLPLLLRQRLPWKKKLLMAFPFSLGFFTMVCAILSKVSSFKDPYSVEWVYWYARESSTTLVVTNMPYAWGLIRKVFHLRSFFHDSGTGTGVLPDGDIQRIEGRSIQRTTTVASHQQSRKRSWLWPRAMASATMNSTNQHEAAIQNGSRLEAGKGEKRDPNEPTSSDDSWAGSVQKRTEPVAASDATAIDKIYNLDDIDDEVIRQDGVAQRGYDG